MKRLFWSLMALASVFVVVASCGGSVTVGNGSGTTGSGGAGAVSVSATSGHGGGVVAASSVASTVSSTVGGGGSPPDAGQDAADASMMCTITDQPYGPTAIAAASCASSPPPGAPTPPPPKKYTGGTCPMLVAYDGTDTTLNNITSMGNARSFAVAVPKNLQPNEVLPVIFLWYWLKGSAADFYNTGDVQNAVDNQRFIAVIPNAKGDIQIWNWPFSIIDSTTRQEEEYTFFDDMLSCVAEQFNVNLSCVSTAGVSAGALWTDQLVGARSEYLSSFMSLSGGVGGPFVKPYASPPPPRALPAFILWGGSMDTCIIINFQTESQNLEADMTADCDFVVECIHNCGHGVPPFDFDAGSSDFAGLWQFALDHPYWLPAGTSPYTTNGLPAALPGWCAVGIGNAVPRTGPCNPPGC